MEASSRSTPRDQQLSISDASSEVFTSAAGSGGGGKRRNRIPSNRSFMSVKNTRKSCKADLLSKRDKKSAIELLQKLTTTQLNLLQQKFNNGLVNLPHQEILDQSRFQEFERQNECDDIMAPPPRSMIRNVNPQDSLEGTSMISSVVIPEDEDHSAPNSALGLAKLTGGGVNPFTHDEGPSHPKFSMNLDEWVSTLCALWNTNKVAESAVSAFKLIDSHSGLRGYIFWCDVLDIFLILMQEKTSQPAKQPLRHDGKYKAAQHSKRENISKIIGVASGTTYVYIVVTKYGHVGIYDEKFRLQRSYDIDIDTDPYADYDVAKSDPGWVTDGLWMDNSKHAIYTTSLRTMHFYDASASVHYEEYRAFGFRSIPTCIDYCFQSENPNAESLLLFGDADGGLRFDHAFFFLGESGHNQEDSCVVHFSQPLNSLFAKDEVDSVQCLFWPDMEKHSEYAQIQYFPNLHKDAVLGLKYLAKNETVITISRDPTASLVIRQINQKFDSYVFKLDWGVRCFDYKDDPGVHLVVTGGNDKIVRVWNPVVTSKPTSILIGHKFGLNDVKIHTGRKIVLSYDKDAVLKVWGLDTAECVQTLPLHFPSFKILGKEIVFGKPALYTETASPYLILASCCEHLTCVDLMDESDDESSSEEVVVEQIESRKHIDTSTRTEKKFSAAANLAIVAGGFTETFKAGMPPLQFDDSELRDVTDKMDDMMRSLGLIDENSPRMSEKFSSSPGSSSLTGWSSARSVVRSRYLGRVLLGSAANTEKTTGFRFFKEKQDNGSQSLNVLRVQKYLNKTRMKELARDNMPFMGLEIHGLKEIEFEGDLPHTAVMLQKGIRIRTIEDLVNMKLDSGPAPATGDGKQGGPGQMGNSVDMTSTSTTVSSSSVPIKKPPKWQQGQGIKKLTSESMDKGGLPIITEKSTTPSDVTEASTPRN